MLRVARQSRQFFADFCLLSLVSIVLGCSEPGAPARSVDDDDVVAQRDAGGGDTDEGPQAVVDAGSSVVKRDAGAVLARDAGTTRDAAATVPDAGKSEAKDAATSDPADATLAPTDAGASPSEDCTSAPAGSSPTILKLTGDLGTHDPVVLSADGVFYEFQTGRGVPTKTSTDLLRWKNGPSVFAQNPGWIGQQVAGATDLWAPDISRFNGKVHLYYSASTFGSNKSCIGHATRDSLTSGSWQDQGAVVCSNAGGARDDWNAIDPNLVVDESGTPWLSFGSFWSGIKMVKLTPEGKRADNALISLAGRNGGAIEAPFIVRRCGYYYLFVSFDRCCSGANSTYNVVVGRSSDVKGPYVDRAGRGMREGGGTQVVASAGAWKGPGHDAVLRTEKGDYHVYHAYAAGDGHSELRIAQLLWDAEGWPIPHAP